MKRRLIVMPVIGAMPCSRWALKAWRDYAGRHGADLLEVKWFPERKRWGGLTYYVCIEALRRYGNTVDELLVVDADTMPLPGAGNIFEEGDTEAGLVLVADQGWPTVDHVGHIPSFRERRARELGEEGLAAMPGDAHYGNSGIVLMRPAGWAALDWEAPICREWPPEQDWLNVRVWRDRVRGLVVGWLPTRWNWHFVFHRPNDGLQVLHFTGRRKVMMEDFYRYYYEGGAVPMKSGWRLRRGGGD